MYIVPECIVGYQAKMTEKMPRKTLLRTQNFNKAKKITSLDQTSVCFLKRFPTAMHSVHPPSFSLRSIRLSTPDLNELNWSSVARAIGFNCIVPSHLICVFGVFDRRSLYGRIFRPNVFVN